MFVFVFIQIDWIVGFWGFDMNQRRIFQRLGLKRLILSVKEFGKKLSIEKMRTDYDTLSGDYEIAYMRLEKKLKMHTGSI